MAGFLGESVDFYGGSVGRIGLGPSVEEIEWGIRVLGFMAWGGFGIGIDCED